MAEASGVGKADWDGGVDSGAPAIANAKRLMLLADRGRPQVDLFLGHRAIRLKAAVAVACLQIHEILLARQQRAVADVVVRLGSIGGEASAELLHHPGRNLATPIRID